MRWRCQSESRIGRSRVYSSELVKTEDVLIQTCALLLAIIGRETSDSAMVRNHGAADRGTTRGKWVDDGLKVWIIVDGV